jgi:hypothetical protein
MNPVLMVFGDGSREACCTLVYLRWEREDGTARCCLVTGKAQVAPRVKITIPRMELVAAVNSVRLARKAREALKIPLARTRYFTDSSAVLGMLRTESGKFNEFVGARVSEVKVNSNVEDKWRWLEGNCNPADLGTRSRATPRDMIFGSAASGLEREEATRLEEPKPLPAEKPKAVETEGRLPTGDSQKDDLQQKERIEEEPTQKVK